MTESKVMRHTDISDDRRAVLVRLGNDLSERVDDERVTVLRIQQQAVGTFAFAIGEMESD